MRKNGSRILLGICLLVLLVPIMHQSPAAAQTMPAQTRTDLSGIKVAVYDGTGLAGSNASRDALVKMYEWMNATVDVLFAEDILEGSLDDDYEILAMPGANPVTFSFDLGLEGKEILREWIGRGGSYFGICGGAMFACRRVTFGGGSSYYGVNAFNGSVIGPIGGSSGMLDITVNSSCSGPNLSDIPTAKSSLYLGGGYYAADEGQEMHVVATYDVNSEPATIVAPSGTGTVCLSAIHVEIEEDSDRDNADFYDDDYEDADTEWDMMLAASIWQIESSTWVEPTTSSSTSETTTTNTTDANTALFDAVPPSIMAAAAIGIIVIVVVVFKKR